MALTIRWAMYSLVAALLCPLLRSGAEAAPAAESALSLEQAIRIALADHPRIQAARQRVSAQSGLAASAGALPNLEVLLVPLGTLNDNPVIVSQEFDVTGKRAARRDAARAEVRAMTADLGAVELTVARGVAVAYADLLEAMQVRALTEESVEQARTLHRLAQRRYELGDVPQVHATRTEIEAVRLEDELGHAAAEVAVRKAALNAAMGRDPAAPVKPAVAEEEPRRDLSLPALREQALAQRPEVQAAVERARARGSEVRAARAQRLPHLTFQARTGSREGGAESTQLGLGLSLPLLDWGGIRGQVRAAQAQEQEQNAILAEARNEIALEVEAAFRHAQSARATADTYRDRISPRAEKLVKAMQQSYEQGGSTLPEVLDAQRTYTATRLEQARAAARYRRALAELERAVGGKLP